MKKDLQNYRKSYERHELLETTVPGDPLELFANWFEDAEQHSGTGEVNAMNLATVGTDGYPQSRVVLLKSFGIEGFTFYTNYESDKGKAIAENNKVCLSFFWPALERQVIIRGTAVKNSEESSKEYFNSRPRGSQLGAWASNQSSKVASRESLENKLEEVEARFKDKDVPKPQYWGGYVVTPVGYEFWQGRRNRLHDRLLYSKQKDSSWDLKRLAP